MYARSKGLDKLQYQPVHIIYRFGTQKYLNILQYLGENSVGKIGKNKHNSHENRLLNLLVTEQINLSVPIQVITTTQILIVTVHLDIKMTYPRADKVKFQNVPLAFLWWKKKWNVKSVKQGVSVHKNMYNYLFNEDGQVVLTYRSLTNRTRVWPQN